GEKSIEMIKQSELLPLTGYIHGGCSPIGMKKSFKTTFHEDILSLETVTLSAGRVGSQVELAPNDIINFVRGKTADIIVK
ncbi:MAG TPA: Cys-tRNA(Pro) deacylase, partial [Ruminococcaceae bacterium]|nr:Cys-tRNA(Pro) deacylase [Oscillospiraceae bacterium]